MAMMAVMAEMDQDLGEDRGIGTLENVEQQVYVGLALQELQVVAVA